MLMKQHLFKVKCPAAWWDASAAPLVSGTSQFYVNKTFSTTKLATL